MHMNTNDKNIWIAIEDKDVRQDERRGLNIGAEWAGAVVGAVVTGIRGAHTAVSTNDDDVRRAGVGGAIMRKTGGVASTATRARRLR